MAYRGADPTDVMGRRIGAYLIDAVLAGVVLALYLVPAFTGALDTAPRSSVVCPQDAFQPAGQGAPPPEAFCLEQDDGTVRYLTESAAGDLEGKAWIASILLSIVVNVVLQGLTGATPGKFLCGLRVVNAKGFNAGIGRSALRTLLLPVDSFCCGVVGLVTAFKSRGHRRVGDMVGGTLVVGRKDRDALIIARSGQPLPDLATVTAAQWQAPSPAATPAWGAGAPVADDAPFVPASLPGQQPVATATTATATATPPGLDAPVWDAGRDAYIQFDPQLGAWMQWDDASSSWRPIAT